MPNNPLTQAELTAYTSNTLYPQIPAGYFFASPPTGAGPLAYRLFDASYISIGIINPNRLGTGSTGAGNLYLADNGTWKSITVATPTLAQVTTAGNTTTNSIGTGAITASGNILVTAQNGRYVGFNGFTTGMTVDFRFGDSLNRLANTWGNTMNLISYHGVQISNTTFGDAIGAALKVIGYTSNKPILELANATTTYATVYNNGNFQLQNGGTFTNAGYRLDVNGTTRFVGDSYVSSGDLLLDNDRPIRWKDSGGTFRRAMLITAANDFQFGPVDTGWAGQTYLKAGGGIYFLVNGSSGTSIYAGGFSSAGNFIVDTDTLFVDATNNRVGVGTTSPIERLQIGGNAYITGVGSALYFDTDSGTKTITQYVTNLYEFHILNARGNTSRFILGNNSISLGTSSTRQLYINTTSGNVGIGTTSPISALTVDNGVNGNLTVGYLMTIGTTAQTSSSYGIVGSNVYGGAGDNVYALRTGFNAQFIQFVWNNSIRFHASTTTYTAGDNISGTERMRLTSGGNLLISTTTDSGYKLDVNGTMRSVNGAHFATSSGNVGIGTNAPQTKLEVRGLQNNTVAPANGVAKFVGNDAGIFIGNLAGTPNYGAWIQAMRESDALAFPLILQPTGGNVVIGSTSTPSEKLTVVGNGLFTSTTGASLSIGTGYQPGTTASPLYTNLNFRGYADTIKAQIKSYDVSTNAGGGIMVFSVASTSDILTEYMRISTVGNVGIGTASPQTKLHLASTNSSVRIDTSLSNSAFLTGWQDAVAIGVNRDPQNGNFTNTSKAAASIFLYGQSNSSFINFSTTTSNNTLPTERMRIESSGNLLINTTTDSGYKLNVNGTAYIGGVATLNSDANIAGSVATPQITARKYYQNTNGVPTSNLGTPTITEMALFEAQFNNKTGFYNPANLTFWTSSDGVNYTEYTGFSTTEKKKFLGGDIESNIYIPNLTTRFRIELENSGNYVFLNQLYMYWSSNSHSTQVHIWKQRCDNGVWYQHTNSTTPVGAWPGHLYLPFDTIPYLPLPSTSSIHFNRIRIEFIPTWSGDPTWGSQHISLYRMQIWGGYPAGRRTLYSTDENQNVGFPANISAAGTLTSTGVFTANNTSTFAQLATFNNGISSRSAAPTITLDRNGSYSWRLIVGDGTTYPTSTLNVVTNGGTAITTFLDSGKVGIGTASPGAKLEIDGNSYTTGLRISNTTSHSTNLFQSNTVFNINSQFVGDSISIQPANYLSISTYSGGIVERLRVVNNGNVLINTTTDSGYKLDVNGTARIQGNTTITGTLTTAPTYTNCGLTASVNVAQDTTEVLGFESKIDPNGWWNPGTKRWTPTVYGFYYVTLQVKWDPGTPGNQINIQILRNGGTVALCQDSVPTTVGITQTTNAIIEMNGTTDYVTFTGYSSSTTGEFIVGEPQGNWTFFNAFKLN